MKVLAVDIITVIKEIGAIVTPIVLAWIALLQIRMNRKQEVIHKDVNGKMAELLRVTGAAEKAKGVEQGVEQGREQQRNESETTADKVVAAIKKDRNIGKKKKNI